MAKTFSNTTVAKAPDSPDADKTAAFDFIDVLATRAELTRGRPKRARTRSRILAAAARELSAKGYDGLTVDGICAQADMARGTFYLYYGDRSKVAATVYRTFWATAYRLRPRLREQSLKQRVEVANTYYLTLYAKNAPLLAGQASLARSRPDFAQWHDAMNHRWSLVIADNMPAPLALEEKALRARALVAMADELLSNIFTAQTPSLRHWADHPEQLAATLTAIWVQVVDPAQET